LEIEFRQKCTTIKAEQTSLPRERIKRKKKKKRNQLKRVNQFVLTQTRKKKEVARNRNTIATGQPMTNRGEEEVQTEN